MHFFTIHSNLICHVISSFTLNLDRQNKCEKDCINNIWQLNSYKFVLSMQARSALYPDCFPQFAIENQEPVKTLRFEHESDQNSTNSNLKPIFSSDWIKSPCFFQDYVSSTFVSTPCLGPRIRYSFYFWTTLTPPPKTNRTTLPHPLLLPLRLEWSWPTLLQICKK